MQPIRIICLSILILVFCGITSAQSYYIDYTSGNDNNSGISPTTAWKHCPGDPSATGNPSSTTLGPGDTVLFKGTYLGQVNINGSGNASSPIVFIGTENWNTGRTIFDMQNIRAYAFKGGSDYIKIQGFNIYNYSNAGSDSPIMPSSGASNWIIDNCTIAFVSGWATIGSSIPKKYAINLGRYPHFTIKNCEFYASGRTVIFIQGASDILIEGCNFGGINIGADTLGFNSVGIRIQGTSHDITIRKNVLHDFWRYGGDVTPELFHAPDYITAYANTADPSLAPHNITIEQNYFYTNKQLEYGSGTGEIGIGLYTRHLIIRNNVFVNSVQYWGWNIMLRNGCDSIWIDNNTFVIRAYTSNNDAKSSIGIFADNEVRGGTGDHLWIRNNIFYCDNDYSNLSGGIRVTGNGGFTAEEIDYNAYYAIDGTPLGRQTLAQWQSSIGYDAHSQNFSGSYIFTDFPSSPANSSSGDYTLSSSAPTFLTEGGKNLSSLFSTDFNGATRTVPWSIGAYEFDGVSGIQNEDESLEEFALEQNYPNPFNPNTKIRYSVPQSSNVFIKVFDILGNEIETLIDEEKQVGNYEVDFNAATLPSGVYFYRLQASNFVETKKMILQR